LSEDGEGRPADGASVAAYDSRVAIVIPAFNEAKVIADVVSRLRSDYPWVIVIDDCSLDATAAEAVRAGATVLRHVVNLGQGGALQTGMTYAIAKGAEVIVTFDADGQHRTEDIAVLIEAQHRTGSDVITGSRFLGKAVGVPPARRLMLKAAVIFTRITTGQNLTDAHNGLRLFTRTAAARIRITQNRMAHASELVSQMRTSGLKVTEAPVTILYTSYSLQKGQKISNLISVLFEMLLARISKA
jgi:glycosyltransferase involved in cell wall biosynthesis